MSTTTEQMYAADTFEEFWEHYQEVHASRNVRVAHATATGMALLLMARAVARRSWKLAIAAPLIDHAIAQASHRMQGEKTDPMRRPWWHARAEWRLFRSTLRSFRHGRGGRREPLADETLPPMV
jgi:hypothetical protein